MDELIKELRRIINDDNLKIEHYKNDPLWIHIFETQICIGLDFKSKKAFLDLDLCANPSRLELDELNIITKIIQLLEEKVGLLESIFKSEI